MTERELAALDQQMVREVWALSVFEPPMHVSERKDRLYALVKLAKEYGYASQEMRTRDATQ